MKEKLPGPREQLAGCVWLPRILAKARWLADGQLPPEYAQRFCSPTGIDNQLLTFFGLTKDDVLILAGLPETSVGKTFLKRIGGQPGLVEKWNHLALNLGRPGFPLAERLPLALATTYKTLPAKYHHLPTVFEIIEADEGLLEIPDPG